MVVLYSLTNVLIQVVELTENVLVQTNGHYPTVHFAVKHLADDNSSKWCEDQAMSVHLIVTPETNYHMATGEKQYPLTMPHVHLFPTRGASDAIPLVEGVRVLDPLSENGPVDRSMDSKTLVCNLIVTVLFVHPSLGGVDHL